MNCRAAANLDEAAFNRRLLHGAPPDAEKALAAADRAFYVPRLSASTIVFKGMVMPQHLAQFYPDLAAIRASRASVAVFHQRFSTNTLPQWRLAHPYRYLAHNGEINTIEGNRNWARARGPMLRSPLLPRPAARSLPLVSLTGSDSQSLDNMLEVLLMGGLDPLHAMRLLMPPAWHGLDAHRPGPARLLRVLLARTWSRGTDPPASCSPTAATPCARSTATDCGPRASVITKNRCPHHRLRERACGTTRPRTWCARASSGPATCSRSTCRPARCWNPRTSTSC
mgnify:CR=1 FL=1